MADSCAEVVTGLVITIASTEKPCCWAYSSASDQSPSAAIGAARQAQRSPPFSLAAVIWVFRSLAGMPRALSRSLSVFKGINWPTLFAPTPMKRK
ncbi:hypothetical protein D3C81_1510770 [compost metagenome]